MTTADLNTRPPTWAPRHRRPRALISGPVATLGLLLAWLAIVGAATAAGIEQQSLTVGIMTGFAAMFATVGCGVVVLAFAALMHEGRE